MQWLNDAWYVAMYARDLVGGKLEARTLLDEPLVLFRAEDGRAVALEDRCPHRNAPMRLGHVTDAGQLVCGYHGLVFDGAGQCVRNPHGNGRIPAGARIKRYPVVERHSLIWVWMGASEPNEAMIPDLSFIDPAVSPYTLGLPDKLCMNAPWHLMVDNLMDLSHANTLHDGLLGNSEMDGVDIAVREEGDSVTISRAMQNVTPPKVIDLMMGNDGRRLDLWHEVTWHLPSVLVLDIRSGYPGTHRDNGTGNLAVHALTPQSRDSTLYHYMSARLNPLPRTAEEEAQLRTQLGEFRRIAFAEQDAPMLRGQHETISHFGGKIEGVMLQVDAGVARWRKLMMQRLG
jgi:phenylpropionate dioxygenase-like ring-hydroxylating dioxygenase large terminal subunit